LPAHVRGCSAHVDPKGGLAELRLDDYRRAERGSKTSEKRRERMYIGISLLGLILLIVLLVILL
jgi:hypothetical protein